MKERAFVQVFESFTPDRYKGHTRVGGGSIISGGVFTNTVLSYIASVLLLYHSCITVIQSNMSVIQSDKSVIHCIALQR